MEPYMTLKVFCSLTFATIVLAQPSASIPDISTITQDSAWSFYTITDIRAGSDYETVIAINTQVFPVGLLDIDVQYISGATVGSLRIRPGPGQTGMALLTITVVDQNFEVFSKSIDIYIKPKPVHCVYTAWSVWSRCSSYCDGGQRSRSRGIMSHGHNDGKICRPREMQETQSCNTAPCVRPSMDVITDRLIRSSSGSQLHQILLTGIKGHAGVSLNITAFASDSSVTDLKVHYTFPDSTAGLSYRVLPNSDTKTVILGIQLSDAQGQVLIRRFSLQIIASGVDCTLEWSSWGPCNVSCGVGYRHRNQISFQGGVPCPTVLLQEKEVCQQAPCGGSSCSQPNTCVDQSSQCPTWAQEGRCSLPGISFYCRQSCCPLTCLKPPPLPLRRPPTHTPTPPVQSCGFVWSAWSVCTVSCGGGIRTRQKQYFANQQGCPPVTREAQPCNESLCQPVDCQYTWGEWGKCSKPCGGGYTVRRRTIVSFAAHGGTPCRNATRREGRECNTQQCQSGAAGDSCVGRCGKVAPSGCGCDAKCTRYNDCCDNYEISCVRGSAWSCLGKCGKQASDTQRSACWCDDNCVKHNNCCDDYTRSCGNGVLNTPLQRVDRQSVLHTSANTANLAPTRPTYNAANGANQLRVTPNSCFNRCHKQERTQSYQFTSFQTGVIVPVQTVGFRSAYSNVNEIRGTFRSVNDNSEIPATGRVMEEAFVQAGSESKGQSKIPVWEFSGIDSTFRSAKPDASSDVEINNKFTQAVDDSTDSDDVTFRYFQNSDSDLQADKKLRQLNIYFPPAIAAAVHTEIDHMGNSGTTYYGSAYPASIPYVPSSVSPLVTQINPLSKVACYCDIDCVTNYDCCPDFNQLCTVQVQEKIVYVPVEKTVEIVKEVPIIYPVPVEVEVPVEVVVEKVVSIQVPVIVPVPVQVIIEKEVPVQVIVEKEVYVPYPVEVVVEKEVPFAVPYPVEVQVPVVVPFPVEVRIDVPVPYPVEVVREVAVPFAVPVEVNVPYPVEVQVVIDRPYPVEVVVGVPVLVAVPVEVRIEVDRPVAVAVPVPVAVPVEIQVEVERPVPYPVEVQVPYPVEVQVFIDRTYPVEVVVGIPVPVLVPVEVDKPVLIAVPVEVKVPFLVPIEVPVPKPIFVDREVRVPVAVDRPVPYPVRVNVEVPVVQRVDIERTIIIDRTVPVPYAMPIEIATAVDRPVAYAVPFINSFSASIVSCAGRCGQGKKNWNLLLSNPSASDVSTFQPFEGLNSDFTNNIGGSHEDFVQDVPTRRQRSEPSCWCEISCRRTNDCCLDFAQLCPTFLG